MIRGLLEHHATRSAAAPALLIAPDGTAMLGRRIAQAVNAAAKLSGLHPGSAEYAREKRYIPEPFAVSFTVACTFERCALLTSDLSPTDT